MGKYIDGLIADLPRKNGWTLAEHAVMALGERTYQGPPAELIRPAVTATDR